MPALGASSNAKSARRGQIRDQIEIGSGPTTGPTRSRSPARVRSPRTKGLRRHPDDITDLLSAQRTGAWADVARRIAHEIKNPLTRSSSKSAERLRRRYAKKLEDDFEVFDKSINTIPPGGRHRAHGRQFRPSPACRGGAVEGRPHRYHSLGRVPRKHAAP